MNISIRAKLAILILVLLIPVIFIGVNKIYEEYNFRIKLRAVQEHVNETKIIARFIHELEQERALSLVYLAAATHSNLKALHAQREQTDIVFQKIWTNEAISQDNILYTVQDKLLMSRDQIDKHSISNTEAEKDFIEMATLLIENAINKANLSSIHDLQVRDDIKTHFHLVEGKDEFGKLRISILRFADLNDTLFFDPLKFAQRKGAFNTYMKEFERTAPAEVLNVYESLTQLPEYTSVLNLTDSIYAEEFLSMNMGIQQVYPQLEEAMSLLRQAEEFSMNHLIDRVKNQIAETDRLLWLVSVMILLLLAAAIFLSWTIFSTISISVKRLKKGARKVAVGDNNTNITVASGDELGELAAIFNDLVRNNQILAERADQIGEGNYELPVPVRSEKDELGNALDKMRLNLKELSEKDRKRHYILEGIISLNETLQTFQNLDDISQPALNVLCEYSNARVGGLYLTNGQDDEHLTLKGTYAINREKVEAPEIDTRTGLVAQSLQKQEAILIEDAPPDYIKVTSGLGSAPLKHLMILPLLHETAVVGAIEVGSINGFTAAEQEFLRQAAEKISVAFYTLSANQRLQTLLGKTQQQTEELRTQEEELRQTNKELRQKAEMLQQSEEVLRTQQEELRQTNEELEGQTQRLRASEEEMKTQQEELQEKNTQLEEKTQQLEEQNEEMQRKNRELENARKDIDRKARELEVTGKYKSEFLANMSHELRTPLNSILILARLLTDNKNNSLSEKQVEFAQMIHQSGNDLLRLINEILDISKIEAGKVELNPEDINLRELDITQGLEQVAQQRKIDLSIERDENLPPSVFSDKHRLLQVLRNLISNALKFTHEGGKVKVQISKAQEETYRSRHLNEAKAVIAFSVSDTGIGIPENKREAIFQAFQQAESSISRNYGGTGLGLSISREITTLLGGQIDLESEVGKGSTFTLMIPDRIPDEIIQDLTEKETSNTEEAAAAAQPENAPLPVPAYESAPTKQIEAPTVKNNPVFNFKDSRGNIQPDDPVILILENDPQFAQVLHEFAIGRSFKTLVSNQGDEGLRLAKQYKPEAIILDLNLAEVDGYTVLNRLKSNPALVNIPVQVLSGQDKEELIMGMGADGYARKPVATHQLEQLFKNLSENLNEEIKSILIIEDNEVHNKAIEELICRHGSRCLSALSGEEALDVLAKEKIDCVVLDLNLPDISGFDLLERIKKKDQFKNLPCIVYSGRNLTREEEKRLKKHSGAIVLKTAFSYDRLLDEVNLFLHHIGADLPQEKTEKLKPYIPEKALTNKKVVLADDDIRNVYALHNVLEEEGMIVFTAENGKEAIDLLHREMDIDIVLMDIMMPVMDGYEAMRKIREQEEFARLPIIALTAKAMRGDREKCIEAGASDYLAKPVDKEKLIGLMRVLLYQ
ncbi:MAG: response regulator [Bacteroidia bacterium]